jgi:hypothetical protein
VDHHKAKVARKSKKATSQKRICDSKLVAIERRPELGSLFFSLLGFALAFPCRCLRIRFVDRREAAAGRGLFAAAAGIRSVESLEAPVN